LEESAVNSRWIRATLAGVWVLLFVGVIAAIRFQGKFFSQSGQHIAHLAATAGSVQVRSEELISWRNAEQEQKLFEGDRVATGKRSRARISFSEGRDIVVGEDSQVAITAIQQGEEFSFIVNLVRGTVEGSQQTKSGKAPRKSLPLTIRSGARTLTVESAKSVGMVKPVGAPAKVYVPTKAMTLPRSIPPRPVAGSTSGGPDSPQGAGSEPIAATDDAPLTDDALFGEPGPPQESLVDLSKLQLPSATEEAINLASANGLESSGSLGSELAPAPPPPPPAPAPAAEVIPLTSPEPSPVAKKRVTEPRAVGARDLLPVWKDAGSTTRTLWALLPTSTIRTSTIQIPLAMRKDVPSNVDWRPAVELRSAEDKDAKDSLIRTGSGRTARSIAVPLEIITRRFASSESNGFPTFRFRAQAGSIVGGSKTEERESRRDQAFGGPTRQWQINAIADSKQSFAIALDRLAMNSSGQALIAAKPQVSFDNAPVTITVLNGAIGAKAAGFIRGADRVAFRRQSFSESVGTFVVAKRNVVAEVSGSAMTPAAIATIRRALGADYVFRGRRSSLFDTRSGTSKQLVSRVEQQLDAGRSVYVMKDDRLFPVNRQFIKTSSEVARFVDANANAVFFDEVQILSFSE